MTRTASSEKRPTIAWLEKRAQQLRLEVSQRLAKEHRYHDLPVTSSSHYELYHDKLPLPSGKAALHFNDAVTTTVLNEFVLTESDPYVVTFLASKVIEQTYYLFFDPACPDRPIKNLAVAKHYGTFFTPPEIACEMAEGLLRNGGNKTLFDPCAGSGVLLCAPLVYCHALPYEQLIGLELDEQLAAWAQLVINRVALLTEYRGHISITRSDGLEILLSKDAAASARETDVIINPPYGRLRLNKDRVTNVETLLRDSTAVQDRAFSDLQSTVADHAQQLRTRFAIFAEERGILEYSKIFFRACAELALRGAKVAIITPDSWMSGSEGLALRAFLLKHRLVEQILLIRENARSFSTVNQATSITFLCIGNNEHIAIGEWPTVESSNQLISYDDLTSNTNLDLAIPRISGFGLNMFHKLSAMQKLSDLPWCTNARGELDQTAQKSLFIAAPTTIRLVRGEHVERFRFRHSSSQKKPSFIAEAAFHDYILTKPKRRHFEGPRIVGRQCSYAQQARRLVFSMIPAGHAVGNSCNYLSVDGATPAESDYRRYLLLGLLNSAVLDWYFRIENSNNHVGNYEIDKFPFPENERWHGLIASIAFQIEHLSMRTESPRAQWLFDLLEATVGLAYNLDPETELRRILEAIGGCAVAKIVNYASHLQRGTRLAAPPIGYVFFNHKNPSLSELDQLIISHVPEGGNWQNIPDTVPSQRLRQIREMTAERGVVRTTYYGRLRRDQPAYTINTYFNRPGNGTHIHPVLDRTLTSREAARLQSFPDSYLFTGSEGAIRDQIGNAVPPLLSAAIGRKLLTYATTGLCVDFFCGAGGLSLGLESAGWQVLCAIDNNQDALDTYCLNRPCDIEPENSRDGYTAVLRRDLHDRNAFEDSYERITRALNGRTLDLLVGGPPCQGFSHAGFRLSNDKRNDLASIYLHFAERLKPRLFVLENVEGLATFNHGQVLRDICSTLTELGYRISEPVWKLCAEQYGVPQMRRRVFVVATIDPSIYLSPPTPTHEKCAGRRADKLAPTLFDSILPPPATVAVALAGLSLPELGRQDELVRWLAE